MKIALFNTISPFVSGGAEILVGDLMKELKNRGFEAHVFRLPFPNDFFDPNVLFRTILSANLIDFSEYDKVIAFKFPAFYAIHPNKVLWLFHQFRQVYDMYNLENGFKDDDIGKAVREIVYLNDCRQINNARVVYAISESSKRLKQYNGIESNVLMAPLKDWELYHYNSIGDYIYYPSRISRLKRQDLAVEAMKYVKTPVKLILDGKCPDEAYDLEIRRIIEKNHLENKVTYNNGWVEDDDKIKKYSDCLGALYIAYQEDSCGFGTMESFYSSKPVISCTDSGGTYELIEDKKTGLFVEPKAEALAKAMDEFYDNKKRTYEMGQAARQEIIRRNINWDETIRKLMV